MVFGLTVTLAAPSVGWLDGGELVAAAWDLGVSHPPGQPLPTLLWRLAMAIPAGNIAFRATLVSGACAALACFPLLALARDLAGEIEAPLARVMPWLVALPAALGVATLTQAVRTEVYAIQLLLALVVLAAASAAWRGDAPGRARAALVVTGALGLSGATHPLLAVGLLPAGVVGWIGAVRAMDRRAWFGAAGGGAAALGLQLYLPLRSAARPELAWGMPHTPAAFWSVISGRAFAQNFSPSDEGMLGHNLGVVARVLSTDSGLALVLLAAVGLVGLAVARRRVGLILLALAVGGNLATVLFQNKVFASNPDLHGYLCLTTTLLSLLASVALLRALDHLARGGRFGRPALLAWAVAGALVAAQIPAVWQSSLAGNYEPERLARAHQDGLPPGATLVTAGNSSAFVEGYLQRVERRRPDLRVFHRTLLGHPFYELALRQRFGDPPAGVDTHALRGRSEAALAGDPSTVALEIREPDLALADRLVPAGRVMWLSGGPAPLEPALGRHAILAERWCPSLDSPLLWDDPEARSLLLYERLLRASYFRERGRDDLLARELAATVDLAPGETLEIPAPASERWWRAP